MDILSGNELKSLMQRQLGICVSIYMPAVKNGTGIQQNQIRYKILLRNAEDRLLSSELRPSEIKTYSLPRRKCQAISHSGTARVTGLSHVSVT